jgi:hypothetical protein
MLCLPHYQVERRNRLRILQPWLEALVATGNTERATHNAIGKIYITLNREPVAFLKNNQFYDPKGAYADHSKTLAWHGNHITL